MHSTNIGTAIFIINIQYIPDKNILDFYQAMRRSGSGTIDGDEDIQD